MTEIRISRQAFKDIQPMARSMKTRINEAFVKLGQWPNTSADIKPL